MRREWIVVAMLVALVAGCAESPRATLPEPSRPTGPGAIDAQRARSAGGEPEPWLLHGRTYAEQRHSPLAQVTRENVGGLGLAWSFDLGSTRGVEATPIVVGGVMYVTSTWSRLFALDAETGALLWRFDPQVPRAWGLNACCDVVNRGVAVWKGLVLLATLDGRLIALDAGTGERAWEVQTTPEDVPYTITGAPRVVKDKVLIGNGGAELGVRGYVTAYDAATGKQIWRFYTVPGDPSKPFENPELEQAAATWNGEWWKIGGGGTVWDSIAYDPELDLLYVGTGNGAPWTRAARSPGGGDNLYLCAILALRPDTGELVWHYQTTPGDNWDYTSVQHIVLANLTIEGKPRKVLMQVPKNGFFYVLDRATGALISADPVVPITWATHVDPKTGRPVETEIANYDDQPRLVAPATLGAHNWHPMSFHPGTGLVYVPAMRNAAWFTNDPAQVHSGAAWRLGLDIDAMVERLTAEPPTMSAHLIAWDPVAAREVWRVDHAGYWNAGVLTTGGGLVFQGAADGFFSAYDAASGERLFSVDTTTGIMAAPISYRVAGVQYVAVATGWGGGGIASGAPEGGAIVDHLNEGRVLVFRLGGRQPMPVSTARDRSIPRPPPLAAPPDVVARGKSLYHGRCSVCHGLLGITSYVVPDLRVLTPQKHDAFDAIVRGGALESRGMPRFDLQESDVEALHAYVIELANDFYDENPTLRQE